MKRTRQSPLEKPPVKKEGEAWKSKACANGKHGQCTGKLEMIPGKCECLCHVEKPPVKAA